MTPEQFALITLAATLFSALITGVVNPLIGKLISSKKERYEGEYDFSQTIKQYVASGGDIAEMALKIANEYEKQAGKLNTKIDEQSAKIDSLTELVILQNEYIKTVVDIMRAAGLDIPPRPDKLRDSNPRIKAVVK